jgi:hypothetical protein
LLDLLDGPGPAAQCDVEKPGIWHAPA